MYPFQINGLYMITLDQESLLTVIFKERRADLLTFEVIEEDVIEKVNELEETIEFESVNANVLGSIWIKESDIKYVWFKHDSLDTISWRLKKND